MALPVDSEASKQASKAQKHRKVVGGLIVEWRPATQLQLLKNCMWPGKQRGNLVFYRIKPQERKVVGWKTSVLACLRLDRNYDHLYQHAKLVF